MRRNVSTERDLDKLRYLCRCVGRKFVRTAFCLAMPLEKIWTDDISLSAELFARHYPEQRNNILSAARWAVDPVADRGVIIELIDDLGVWLLQTFERIKGEAVPVPKPGSLVP